MRQSFWMKVFILVTTHSSFYYSNNVEDTSPCDFEELLVHG